MKGMSQEADHDASSSSSSDDDDDGDDDGDDDDDDDDDNDDGEKDPEKPECAFLENLNEYDGHSHQNKHHKHYHHKHKHLKKHDNEQVPKKFLKNIRKLIDQVAPGTFFACMDEHNQGTQKEDQKVQHTGYVCDNCDQTPITGVRYKCSVCPNYDLCERC